MKLWISVNSKKSGPHELFTIRDKIESGEVHADTPAWYDGLSDWTTLSEVPSLQSLFKEPAADGNFEFVPEPISTDTTHSSAEKSRVAQAPKLHAIQRFSARVYDLLIYQITFMIILTLSGIDIIEHAVAAENGAWRFLPYLVLDAIFVHLWATSLGKKLLGIRVTSEAGSHLKIGASLMRSLRVWVLGFGMAFLWFISLPVSYFLGKKFGKFIWDVPKNHQVTVKPIGLANIVIALAILLALLSLLGYVLPEKYSTMSYQEVMDQFTPIEK